CARLRDDYGYYYSEYALDSW
nr:immunoglobulin heavy chain junction region [Macaca mulatta]